MQEGQQPRTPVLFPDARSNSLVSWIDVLLCSLGSSLMSTLILQLQALTNSIVRSAQLAIRVLAIRELESIICTLRFSISTNLFLNLILHFE